MTRHEAELLRKKRVTRKLMEELFTAPPPPGRPPAVRLKPSRCVLSVVPAAHHLGCGVGVTWESWHQVGVSHETLAPGCEKRPIACVAVCFWALPRCPLLSKSLVVSVKCGHLALAHLRGGPHYLHKVLGLGRGLWRGAGASGWAGLNLVWLSWPGVGEQGQRGAGG